MLTHNPKLYKVEEKNAKERKKKLWLCGCQNNEDWWSRMFV